MSVKNAKYKFEKNLLEISKSKNINDALIEWENIFIEQRDKQNALCICQKKLKNVYYMYNKTNMKTIIVGGKCLKKFSLKEIEKNIYTKAVNNVFKKVKSNGEYDIIDDIDKYSSNVEQELIDYITKEFEINLNDEYKLQELIKNIKLVIDKYNLNYLNDKCNEISNQIKKIENERIENERSNQKKLLENERIENERIENKRIENKRIENKRIENKRSNQKKLLENERIENKRIENERIENERIIDDIDKYFYRDKDGVLYDMETFECSYVISNKTNEIKNLRNWRRDDYLYKNYIKMYVN